MAAHETPTRGIRYGSGAVPTSGDVPVFLLKKERILFSLDKIFLNEIVMA